MGIYYRDGSYRKSVLLGKRTVKDGEAAAIWNYRGEHREVIGPCLAHMFFSTVQFLNERIAHPHQYLVIQFKTGHREHRRGPAKLFENPVLHESVTVMNAINLPSSSDCIVVYTEMKSREKNGEQGVGRNDRAGTHHAGSTESSNVVSRRIVSGPNMFVPKENEWIHDFVWHGHSFNSPSFTMIPGLNKFNVLRTNIQRWNVEIPMKTSDHVQVSVRMTVSLHVVDVTTLLETCKDPIGLLTNALESDVSAIGSDFSGEQLHEKLRSCVSSLDSFPTLLSRANSIGYRIIDCLLSGFAIPEPLQHTYDEKLKMEAKLEAQMLQSEQKQKIIDRELDNASKRAGHEFEIEKAKLKHKLEVEAANHEALLKQQAEINQQTLDFLEGLRQKDVDLTKLLVASKVNLLQDSPAMAAMMHFSNDKKKQEA